MLARKLLWPLAVSVVASAAVMVNYGGFTPWAFAGVFAAIWVTVATLWDLWDKSASRHGRVRGLKRLTRSYWGMVLGHIGRSEEHTSELQSRPHLVCRLLLEK